MRLLCKKCILLPQYLEKTQMIVSFEMFGEKVSKVI